MYNDLAYRRLRLAEAEMQDCANTESVIMGRTRSRLRGDTATRPRLRQFIQDLHYRGPATAGRREVR